MLYSLKISGAASEPATGELESPSERVDGPVETWMAFRKEMANALMLFIFWTDGRRAKPRAAGVSFANYNKVFSDSALCALL